MKRLHFEGCLGLPVAERRLALARQPPAQRLRLVFFREITSAVQNPSIERDSQLGAARRGDQRLTLSKSPMYPWQGGFGDIRKYGDCGEKNWRVFGI